MTIDPGPPPLHEIDGHHAVILGAVRGWADTVYPEVIRQNPDRTRAWWQVSADLAALTMQRHTDPVTAIAWLAEMTAELLLSHSENIHGKDQST